MIQIRLPLRAFLLAIAALAAAVPASHAQEPVVVSYRAADVVYLTAGHADGLVVGERVSAAGAELAVTHLARNTAACRILAEGLPVRPGEPVTRRLARPAMFSGLSGSNLSSASVGPGSLNEPLQPQFPELVPRGSILQRMRIDGYLTSDWEVFRGSGSRGDSSDYERRTTRLNLRARGLAGDGNQIRIRMTGQSYSSSNRDRIYEAAFIHQLDGSPLNFSLGRLAGGPRIGYGALDGSLLEFNLQPGLAFGGFYGSSSELASLAFDDSSRRYGLFFEYFNPNPEASRSVDLRMSSIREELLGQLSRDYLTLESRLGARDGRWSFHQLAEVDLNTGWRSETSGSQLQLSSLSLRLARRFDRGRRLSISYDRFQLYRTADTRWLLEELFDDRPRHALRANFSLGQLRGWRLSLGAGVRARDGDPDRSYSFSARARSVELTPWRLILSADLMVFSNPLTDGYTTRLRTVRSFKNHRRLYVDLGRRQWQGTLFESAQSAHWLRLGSDIDLGRNLSARGEYEISSGDALAGNRFLLGLRYRIRSHP